MQSLRNKKKINVSYLGYGSNDNFDQELVEFYYNGKMSENVK